MAASSFEIPSDPASTPAASDAAAHRFDALAGSHEKEYVQWITEAKRPGTRERRVARTVEMLPGGGDS